MARAKQFSLNVNAAVNVLAQQAAKKAVKEQLRASGNRRLVPHREIVAQAKAHLEAHPELYEQARQRAWQMGFGRSVSRQITSKCSLKSHRNFLQPEVISAVGAY